MQNQTEFAGYLFSYFTGEETADGEQIYFALSKGNNPLDWQELNNGKPVLTSSLGEKGVRDPYLFRSSDGDKFYLIATDLRIHGNGDWQRAVTEGSRNIMIWESTNLIEWSNQRMVEIAPPEAGCTWAPEIHYDKSSSEYLIFWASMLPDKEPINGSKGYHKMLYVKTKDFTTFTKPQVFIDYGCSIIDTTVIEHKGQMFRFSKGKHIVQESGSSFLDGKFKLINDNVENEFMNRGEGPIVFKSNVEEKWYLFIDEYGLRGYLPLETTDLTSGKWNMPKEFSMPITPRHGSVLPVTKSEYDRLCKTYLNKNWRKKDGDDNARSYY
ncbi:glycoside hydrolase family 43 protein [Metabacillus schmidteae]|uniref:glycoside hydrolase family 43 protein n=1 Tax=Metabacillus schmidteae TaxID=2730405 RepID=UPI00158D32AF|nr:glycoside hydrolase family 43 protein [Metabacillus schmidteae]